MTGEFYADFDEDSNCWCVFHTESIAAWNICVSKEEAEFKADEKNSKIALDAEKKRA